MAKSITTQIIRIVTLLLGVTILTFVLLYNSPINTIDAYIGEKAVSELQKANIIAKWGLDEPFFTQYTSWLKNVLCGDFGESIAYQRSVITIIKESFYSSLLLMGFAWLISGILGFSLGIIAGFKQNSIIDKIINTFSLILISTPSFWLGLLLLMFFSVYLGIFPLGFASPIGKVSSEVTIFDTFHHLFLPALTLSIVGISPVILHTRAKVIEILNSDFILFAKALGKSKREIIFSHILKNSALPALTLQFASFGELFGGSILAEKVFSYSGLGSVVVNAGMKGDMQLLLGITLFASLFVFFGNFCANILYNKINPEIKKGKLS
ncbi:MAG: ABC transporter permease [Campylobacteraceae bacterium]